MATWSPEAIGGHQDIFLVTALKSTMKKKLFGINMLFIFITGIKQQQKTQPNTIFFSKVASLNVFVLN